MRLIVFIFFLAFGIVANGQSAKPGQKSDSLMHTWNDPTITDTIRLAALDKLIWSKYISSDLDSAFYYSMRGYNYAHDRGLLNAEADALSLIGECYERWEIYDTAWYYNMESLELYKTTGNKDGMADVFRSLGILCDITGNYTDAVSYINQSLEIWQELGDRKYVARSYSSLGIIYDNLGNTETAIGYFKAAAIISRELNDSRNLASTLKSIGIMHISTGEYVLALNYLQQSLEIETGLSNQIGISKTLHNIGIVYDYQGDDVKARTYFLESLKIKRELDDKVGVANTLNSIGVLFLNAENYDSAWYYFDQSMEIRQLIGEKKGVATSLNNKGSLYEKTIRFEQALEYYFSSLALAQEIGHSDIECRTLNKIGNLYYKLANYNSAISFGLKSVSLSAEIKANSLEKEAALLLYRSYLKKAEPDSAGNYLELLLKLVTNELVSNFFHLSEREKELYFSTMEDDFGRYFDFTLFYAPQFENLTDTAYNIALQNKGLTLKSSTAMRAAILNSGDSLLITDYENWIQIKRKISDLYSRGGDTKELENEANELEKGLVERSAAFSDFDKIKKLDWKQIRSSLKPGECSIEFEHFKSEIDTTSPVIYVALLIKPDSEHPEIIRLCNESDLIEILGTFQGNNLGFVNSVYGTREEAQTALYKKIWQPLENYLEGVKTVYYSPSGLLHKISFASISKSQNIFLSDVYNFRQMGSTGKIALPEDVAFGELENFLLMGGVNYNSQNSSKEVWSYLPGSLQETESINSFLQKKKFGVNYFHSNNASEEIFKEKIVSSSIVHIATHGFFFPDPEKVREEMKVDSESNQELKFRGTTNYANWSFVNNKNPLMRSGIVLANANDVWERDALAEGEDGILTAQEVSNLDLRNTKLVVLSACETGLGDIHGSEGVFGLQRAFKMAGVKYLIMSLWQVPDKETSEFMQLFYRNLIKEKDVPVAFQKTQKVMREKYDPYFWGAFILIE